MCTWWQIRCAIPGKASINLHRLRIDTREAGPDLSIGSCRHELTAGAFHLRVGLRTRIEFGQHGSTAGYPNGKPEVVLFVDRDIARPRHVALRDRWQVVFGELACLRIHFAEEHPAFV